MRRPWTGIGAVLADRSVVAIVGIAFVLMLGNGIVLPGPAAVCALVRRRLRRRRTPDRLLRDSADRLRPRGGRHRRSRRRACRRVGRARAGQRLRAAHGSGSERFRSRSSAGARWARARPSPRPRAMPTSCGWFPGTGWPGRSASSTAASTSGSSPAASSAASSPTTLGLETPLYAAAGLAVLAGALYLRYVPRRSPRPGTPAERRDPAREASARGSPTCCGPPASPRRSWASSRTSGCSRRCSARCSPFRARRARHVAERHRRRLRRRARGRAPRPLSGRRAADRHGRKLVLVPALAGTVLVTALLGFAGSPIVLGLARRCAGRHLGDRRSGAERDAVGHRSPRPRSARRPACSACPETSDSLSGRSSPGSSRAASASARRSRSARSARGRCARARPANARRRSALERQIRTRSAQGRTLMR